LNVETHNWVAVSGVKLVLMNERLEDIFAQLRSTADFADVDFSDINACCGDGDNALHAVIRWENLSAARLLIAEGIDVNKAGDLGYTPLHVACMRGNVDMVKLLIDSGADLFAMSEGDSPFATARIAGHDQICDLLSPLMQRAQSQDPKLWLKSRIAQLRREVSRLEEELTRS
jgi:ankyrin repeat protein